MNSVRGIGSVSPKSQSGFAPLERPKPIRPKPRALSGTIANNKIAPNDSDTEIALGENVRKLLIDCYNEIDITIGRLYYSNKELKESLKNLLKLLTKKCPNYIDKVFAGYTEIKDYNLKDFERTYQYLYYKTKKTYYENLLRMSSKGCKNRQPILYIYYYLYGTINSNRDSERYRDKIFYSPTKMKELLKKELLSITPMTSHIRSIIENPFSEIKTLTGLMRPSQYMSVIPESSSRSGGKTNKKRPNQLLRTKLLFGKVRCIYKKSGDKKEYVKHKGFLITIKQYKDIRTRATKNRRK